MKWLRFVGRDVDFGSAGSSRKKFMHIKLNYCEDTWISLHDAK
jgi:hypothetical protein